MYQDIRATVATDFEAVDRFIIEQLHSEVPLVENIGHYIVEAGGKRLRPILVLLAARACDIDSDDHISLAAVIEFIHTATLLHDDVVDMSELRRGRPTVNAQWNNPSSVLVGDFIYSRAFQILVQIGDMRIMRIIADTTNKIAEGEVQQLINKNNAAVSVESYMQVIRNKTAILFQAAGQSAGILAGADDKTVQALRDFGMHLGIAFQLIDDVLDYDGEAEKLGKNIGDDLAEGKPTLPLIMAMEGGSEAEARLIRSCIEDQTVAQQALEEVIGIVRNSTSLEHTRNRAEEEADLAFRALAELPHSQYREALETMVRFSLQRNT